MCYAISNGFIVFLVPENMGLDTKISFVGSKIKKLQHYTCFGKKPLTWTAAILNKKISSAGIFGDFVAGLSVGPKVTFLKNSAFYNFF